MFVSQIKLDAALDGSRGQPSKLVRKLLAAFFVQETLARSSARGSGRYTALDQNVVAAIISEGIHFLVYFMYYVCINISFSVGFVSDKHPNYPQTCIIDAINDKCASYRRGSQK